MKRIVQRLSLVVLLLLPMVMHSQNAVTCGSGAPIVAENSSESNTTTNYFPATSYYRYSYSEVIVLSDVLEGLSEIKALEFNPTSASNGSYFNNCQVYLAHTTQTSLSSGFIADPASFELVYSGSLNFSTSGWKTVVFDTPFEYDGSSNVVVAVLRNHGDYGNQTSFRAYNAGAGNYLARYYQTDSYGPFTLTQIASGRRTDGNAAIAVPQYRLLGCELQVSCDKPSNLNVASAARSATFSWTGATGVASYSIYLNEQFVASTTSTSYTFAEADSLIKPNTDYSVAVRAVCSAGDSTNLVRTSFHSPCEDKTLPLVNYFNNTAALDCWTTYSANTSNIAQVTSDGQYRFTGYYAVDDFKQYLFSPAVAESRKMQLNFSYRTYSANDTLSYGYSSTGNAPANFTWVGLNNTNNITKTLSTVVPAGTKYIAFRYDALDDEGAQYGFIDNFELILPRISNLTITDLATNTATATWTPSVMGETSWQVVVAKLGEEPNWDSAITVTDTTYAMTDLEAWESYTVYVRPVEGEDAYAEVSANFMTLTDCGDNATAAQFDISGQEQSLQEVPFASQQYGRGASWQIFTVKDLRTADKYLMPGEIKGLAWSYSEESPDSAMARFQIFMANTKKKEFADANDTMSRADMTLVYDGLTTFRSGAWNEIKFDSAFNYNGDSNLMVMVYRYDVVSEPNMFFRVNVGPSIQRFSYYDYGSEVLSLSSEKPNRNDSRFSFCYENVSCYPVVNMQWTGLRTATPTLTWERYRDQNPEQFEVIWDTIDNLDSAIASGNSAIVSDTFNVFNTLDTNTTYYVWVRAICGEGDSSRWIADSVSTNNCPVVELPVCEGFETYANNATPNCWYNYPEGTVTIRENSSYPYYAHNGSKYLDFRGSYNNVITLPQPNMDIKNVTLTFFTRSEDSTYPKCGTFSVGYMTDIEDTTTFVAYETYSYSEFSTWEQKAVRIADAPAGAIFAFRHNPTALNYYWFVDDVCMEEAAANIYHTVLDTICIDAINNSYVWQHGSLILDTIDLTEFVGAATQVIRYYVKEGNNDTIEAVRLLMNQNQIVYETVASCEKYTWEEGNGETYTTDTIVAYQPEKPELLENGCAIINGLNLTINQPVTTTIDTVACNWYAFGDDTLNNDVENYAHIEVAANGCDSIISLNLTIEHADTIKIADTVCYEYVWEVNGETFDSVGTGVYVRTIPVEGQTCPNIYELTLTINDTIRNLDSSEYTGIYVAEDTSYINYNANDDMILDFADTLVAESTGCDSIVGRHITIHPFGIVDYYITSTVDTVFWTIAEGKTYRIISDHDTVISIGYIINEGPLAGRVGNVNRLNFFRINPDTVCSNNAIKIAYMTADSNDCVNCYDTLEFTTDTVLNVISNKANDNEVAEDGTTAGADTEDPTTGSTTGEGEETAEASNCHQNMQDLRDTCFENNAITDGIFYLDTMLDQYTRIIYHAVVNPSYDMMFDTIGCDQFVWVEAEDQPVFTEDTLGVVRTLTSVNGCDSIVTLNIHIDTTVVTFASVYACGEYVWMNGEDTVAVITASCDTAVALEAATGCDSIVNLNVTVKPIVVVSVDTASCGEFTWNNDTYTNTHTEYPRFDTTFVVYDTIERSYEEGCDSITALNVTIKGIVDDTITTVALDYWVDSITGQLWFISNDNAKGYIDTVFQYTDSATMAKLGCEDAQLYRHLRVGRKLILSENFAECGFFQWDKDIWHNDRTDTTGWHNGYTGVTYWALEPGDPITSGYKYWDKNDSVHYIDRSPVATDFPTKLDSLYIIHIDSLAGIDSISMNINGQATIFHDGDTLNNGFPVEWRLGLILYPANIIDTVILNYPLSLLLDNDTNFNFTVEGASVDSTFALGPFVDVTKDTQWFQRAYVNMTDTLDAGSCGTIYRIRLQVVNDSVFDTVYICAYDNQYIWIDANNGDTIAVVNTELSYSQYSIDFDTTEATLEELILAAADSVIAFDTVLNAGIYNDSVSQKYYHLYLMQYPFTYITEARKSCNPYIWERDGQTYEYTGVYNFTDTVQPDPNSTQCEFNFVLKLTTPHTIIDTTVCDMLEWRGMTFTESIDTIVYDSTDIFVDDSANVCPKDYTLHLTVNYNIYTYDTNCFEKNMTVLDTNFVLQGRTEDGLGNVYFLDEVTGQTETGCDSIDRHVWIQYTQPKVIDSIVNICWDLFSGVQVVEGGEIYYKPANSFSLDYTDTIFTESCHPDTVYAGTINWIRSEQYFIKDTAASCEDPYYWHYAHNYADSVLIVDSTATYEASFLIDGMPCPFLSTLCFVMFEPEYDTVAIFHSQLPYLYEKHNIDTLLAEAGDYTRLYWDTNTIDSVRFTNLHLEVLPYDTLMVIDTVCYNDTAVYAAGETITLHLADGTGDVTFNVLSDTSFSMRDTSGAFEFNFFAYTVNEDNEPIAEHYLMNTITVLDSHNIIIDTFSCSDFYWIYDEHTYTHDTIVTYTRESSIINPTSQYDIYGCPNRHTLILHFLEYQESFDTIVTCGEYTDVNGNTYTASYDSIDVLESMESGCNMMHHVNLTILDPVSVTIDTTVCGYFLYQGQLLQTSGTATYHYTAANGCDSVVTFNVTVGQPSNTTVYEEACGSYTWNVNGTTYTQSGIYTETLTTIYGCDSVINLVLTINQPVSTEFTVASCNNYTWNGITYTTSGDYVFSGTTVNGCDSIVTMHLTINTPDTTVFNLVGCSSVTIADGITYTTSGVYNFNYTNVNGCDSVVVYNITVLEPSIENVSVVACSEFEWLGTTYTQSGSYQSPTYTAANGCDSIITLHLTINQPVYTTFSDTAELSYTWDDVEYSASGVYTNTYTAANGCDSVVTLNLTITGPATRNYTIIAVANDTTYGYTHGSGQYNYGDVATLTAMAYEGYRFVSWNNGDTLATIYVTVTSDSFFTAYFERIEDPQVGIDDAEETEVVIYSTDSKIIVRGAENRNVYIFDVTGRCVRQQSNVPDTTEFPMENTGVYLVKVGDAPAKRVLVVR